MQGSSLRMKKNERIHWGSVEVYRKVSFFSTESSGVDTQSNASHV